MEKDHFNEAHNIKCAITSVKIPMNERLLEISCIALYDICARYKKNHIEEALQCRETDQLHDALTLIRSGILNFKNTEDRDGTRIIEVKIAIER